MEQNNKNYFGDFPSSVPTVTYFHGGLWSAWNVWGGYIKTQNPLDYD